MYLVDKPNLLDHMFSGERNTVETLNVLKISVKCLRQRKLFVRDHNAVASFQTPIAVQVRFLFDFLIDSHQT